MGAGTISELVLVSLAAMVSPTTLTFCVLTLVLGDRPLRTGAWFFLGAFGATTAVGVAAAFVIGDVASSSTSTPKTWVAVLDVVLAVALFVFAGSRLRRPVDPQTTQAMMERVGEVASSPAVAIVGAGAVLANPGAFIPIALKAISAMQAIGIDGRPSRWRTVRSKPNGSRSRPRCWGAREHERDGHKVDQGHHR